ncbi:hypothetical protein Dimus_022176 [Dionaea muscipula]
MGAEVPAVDDVEQSMPQCIILDPKVSQTKGRKKDPKEIVLKIRPSESEILIVLKMWQGTMSRAEKMLTYLSIDSALVNCSSSELQGPNLCLHVLLLATKSGTAFWPLPRYCFWSIVLLFGHFTVAVEKIEPNTQFISIVNEQPSERQNRWSLFPFFPESDLEAVKDDSRLDVWKEAENRTREYEKEKPNRGRGGALAAARTRKLIPEDGEFLKTKMAFYSFGRRGWWKMA